MASFELEVAAQPTLADAPRCKPSTATSHQLHESSGQRITGSSWLRGCETSTLRSGAGALDRRHRVRRGGTLEINMKFSFEI